MVFSTKNDIFSFDKVPDLVFFTCVRVYDEMPPHFAVADVTVVSDISSVGRITNCGRDPATSETVSSRNYGHPWATLAAFYPL